MRALYSALIATAVCGLTACGTDDGEIVINAIPVTVTIVPTAVETRNEVIVAAAAAPSEGPMTYQWIAATGRFADPAAASTTWTAPDEPGEYSLSVIVSDEERVGIGGAKVSVTN